MADAVDLQGSLLELVKTEGSTMGQIQQLVYGEHYEQMEDDAYTNAMCEQDGDGSTSLHIAVQRNDAALAGFLLEADVDPNKTDKNGNTALLISAMQNRRLLASCLLWGGSDKDAVNNQGNTALHECAVNNAKDVAYLIMDRGGESCKEVKNNDGNTPLEVAQEKGHAETATIIETGEHVD